MSYLVGLYTLVVLLLSLYSLQALVFSIVFMRRSQLPIPPPTPDEWPDVTVQLPIFNEKHVARRLLHAVANLDYPRQHLHIQVLDDSTDNTTALLRGSLRRLTARGFDIELQHRTDRRGFKAGALAAGTAGARGLIAIFDADFVPPPDFLRRSVPFFVADPHLGFLQTRWDHLNPTYSALTRAQAIALDGHFAIEQSARQAAGGLISFNGTAGIWRKACIEACGGWQDDTLCEDLDLSYRAQLQGWHALYRPDITVPAELPPQLLAFKQQQFRWAKGSIQCLRKLWRPVLFGKRPLAVRVLALLQLSGYLVHPLMLLILALSLPMMVWADRYHLPLTFLSLLSVGPPFMYAVAQHTLYRKQPGGWLRRFAYMPVLMVLGVGISLNCTRAVIEGFSGRGGTFLRTPKFHLDSQQQAWAGSSYALPLDKTTAAELSAALYALVTIAVGLTTRNLSALPFLILYAVSFLTVALVGVWQSLQTRAKAGRITRQPARGHRKRPTLNAGRGVDMTP